MVRVHRCYVTTCDHRVFIYCPLSCEWQNVTHSLIFSCQMESILQQVEWVTLLFFMAMFITMECLARLGLIKWIGKQTENLILLADEPMQLTLAIIIILWVSNLMKIFVIFLF